MAFFLIGRAPSGELHLLSTNGFDTRDEAMAELAQLTASSSYDQWDSDVFVVDLSAGVPVLLVRPVPSAPRASLGSLAESVASVEEETEPFVGEEAELVEAEMVLEVVPVEETFVAVELVPEVAEVQEAAPEAELAEVVGDAAIAEAIIEEAEVSEGVPEPLRADEAVAEEAADSSLHDALLRSAEQANPETIATVEAAGDEPVPGTSAAQETAAPAWPWASKAEPNVDVAPDIADVYSSLDQIEPEPLETVEAPLPEIAEPTLTETINAPMSSAEETVAIEDEDEESDFILDLGVVQEAPPAEKADIPVPQTSDEAAREAASAESEPAASAAPIPAASPPPSATPEPVSGLAPEASASPTPEVVGVPPEAGAAVSALQEYTCDDCVYVETCPKRDQQLPKDCGSFQWK